MDYKKAYEQAIERAKGIYYETIVPTPTAKGTCEYIFPELSESEDEEIRYYLINFVKINDGINLPPDDAKKALAWLEKQGTMNTQGNSALEVWKDMRLEVYHQASGNRHEPNYSDDSTKMFSLTDIDEIFEKVAEKQGERKQNVTDIISDLENYFATTTKEQQEKDWEEIKKWEEKHFIHNKHIEQNPTDKAEPKFKVGDWIISSEGTLRHIIAVGRTGYETDKGWLTHDYYEKSFHLWTIKDAKDGDVLTTKNFIFIFKNIDSNNGVRYYCDYEINEYDEDNQFVIAVPQCVMGRLGNGLSYYSPATEEQCDLLFSKMKEAGYDWDSEKKELRKIEQKSEINDDVLSRFAFYQYDNDTIYLSSLFVRESDRKCGYGSKILKAAEEVAETFGISKIRLKVESNTWMEEWYKKNGYEYLSAEGEYDWLEKRVDNLEPKFNVGDWLVCCNYEPEQIIGIRNNMYEMSNGDIRPINMINNNHNIRLWTIKDAKDGDVLYHKSPLTGIEYIVMSRGVNGFGNVDSYFRYNSEDGFGKYIPSVFNAISDDITPATKEQRDFLFQKMHEAGYEWNAEKKELKKIEQKYKEKTKFYDSMDDLIADALIEEIENSDLDDSSKHNRIFWIKSHRQNPTWSEKDEEYLQNMVEWIDCLIDDEDCGDMTYKQHKEFYLKRINWLKSLKERYSWKPTDEQMKQLGWVAVQNKDNMIGKELMPLYQDLKKLKGE